MKGGKKNEGYLCTLHILAGGRLNWGQKPKQRKEKEDTVICLTDLQLNAKITFFFEKGNIWKMMQANLKQCSVAMFWYIICLQNVKVLKFD